MTSSERRDIETVATAYRWRGCGVQIVTRGGYVYFSWRWPFVTVHRHHRTKAY